ncbi:hypothetical protein, partial [Rhizobium sp. P32RR-XVIII]|uniref:hypothetical protein n=1 Tax=Rhizobium sp. P32RR-XVIII TaxID=2726738 RepID=UPI001981F871
TWSVPLSGPVTPNDMADRMDKSLDALLSANSGASRPSYAVAGTEWVSTATAGFLKYYVYDGTADRLTKTINISTGAVTYADGTVDDVFGKRARRGHLYGLTLSNNATDATNDIDIAVGEAASDDTEPFLLKLASALTKRLDAAWAVGTNQGGRMSAAAIADTTYHAWLIQRSDTGVVDVGFDVSATSPTMPANYDRKAYIGPILRSGGTILGFKQTGRRVLLDLPLTIRNSTAAFAANNLTVISGAIVRPIVRSSLQVGASSDAGLQLGDGGSGAARSVQQSINSDININVFDGTFTTNASGQLYYLVTITSGTIVGHIFSLLGWHNDI